MHNHLEWRFILNQTQTARVALITGAAKRIGAAIAKTLHEKGFNVIIHYHHSEKEAFQLVSYLNELRADSAFALKANLMESNQIKSLVQKALELWERLDVLVNNASCFIRTPIQDENLSFYEQLWATNVLAPLYLSEACFSFLSQHQGIIINITDIHADKPIKEYHFYCQTKSALKMQTLALAKEYAPNVRVNAVAPGAIIWPEGSNQLNEEAKHKIIQQTPLQRHGQPQWIADAVYFLIQNVFITGQTISVDGGRSTI